MLIPAHSRPFSPILDCGPQIEYLITNGDSHPRRIGAAAVYAVRQILDGEIRVLVGGGDPAPERRVVRRVQRHRNASA
jgi:hypothetical protein